MIQPPSKVKVPRCCRCPVSFQIFYSPPPLCKRKQSRPYILGVHGYFSGESANQLCLSSSFRWIITALSILLVLQNPSEQHFLYVDFKDDQQEPASTLMGMKRTITAGNACFSDAALGWFLCDLRNKTNVEKQLIYHHQTYPSYLTGSPSDVRNVRSLP